MSSWSPSASSQPDGIWRPELVEVPRRRVPGDAHLVRLRLRDRPGSLASISARLAGYGVDVLRLEVLGRDGGFAVDDLLLTGEGLASALDDLGSDVTLLAHRRGVDLADPGLAMAGACFELARAANARETYRRLLAAALGLVFAEAGFVSVGDGHGVLRPMAATVNGLPALDDREASLLRSALWSGDCLTADGRVPWVADSYRELLPAGTVAVVPAGRETALALVREDAAPFVATELERLAALGSVAVATLASRSPEVSTADVRDLRPGR